MIELKVKFLIYTLTGYINVNFEYTIYIYNFTIE